MISKHGTLNAAFYFYQSKLGKKAKFYNILVDLREFFSDSITSVNLREAFDSAFEVNEVLFYIG
jgi:hypothetical protein